MMGSLLLIVRVSLVAARVIVLGVVRIGVLGVVGIGI